MDEKIKEILGYYWKDGKKMSQDELVTMLREIQDCCGGVITGEALRAVCEQLGVKESYISAVIKFVPDIKTEKVAHRLTICGGVNCRSNGSSALNAYMKKKYQVSPGDVCEKYGFSYEAGGCMKHCAHGPNIKWDGKVYSRVTPAILDQLIQKKDPVL